MKNILYILLCVFLFSFLFNYKLCAENLFNEIVYLPENTVIYPTADCDLKNDFTGILQKAAIGVSLEKRDCRFDLGAFSYCFTLHKIVTEEKKIFWASPQLRIDPVSRQPILASDFSGKCAGMAILLIVMALLYWVYRCRTYFESKTLWKDAVYLLVIFLFQCGIVLYFASEIAVKMIPIDELSYFSVAKELLAGQIRGQQYMYTIG